MFLRWRVRAGKTASPFFMEKREQKPESKKEQKPLKKRKRKPVGKKVIEQEKEKREIIHGRNVIISKMIEGEYYPILNDMSSYEL